MTRADSADRWKGRMLMIVAALLSTIALLCDSGSAGAQQRLGQLADVRVAIEHIDAVALAAGLDSAALRRRIVSQLERGGLSVGDSAAATVSVGVRVLPALPGTDPWATSTFRLTTSERWTREPRVLWHGYSLSVSLPSYRLLSERIRPVIDAQLTALLQVLAEERPR